MLIGLALAAVFVGSLTPLFHELHIHAAHPSEHHHGKSGLEHAADRPVIAAHESHSQHDPAHCPTCWLAHEARGTIAAHGATILAAGKPPIHPAIITTDAPRGDGFHRCGPPRAPPLI